MTNLMRRFWLSGACILSPLLSVCAFGDLPERLNDRLRPGTTCYIDGKVVDETADSKSVAKSERAEGVTLRESKVHQRTGETVRVYNTARGRMQCHSRDKEPSVLCSANGRTVFRSHKPDISVFDAQARGFTLTYMDFTEQQEIYIYEPGPVECLVWTKEGRK